MKAVSPSIHNWSVAHYSYIINLVRGISFNYERPLFMYSTDVLFVRV